MMAVNAAAAIPISRSIVTARTLVTAKKLVEQGYDMVLAAHDIQLLKSTAIELRDSLKTRK